MEKKNKKLPIFKGFIEDNAPLESDGEIIGLQAIGFVDQPATDMNWMAFKNSPMQFKVANKEKRLVSGIAMVADQPIYRNQDGFEFYVQFSKEDIFKLGKRFFKNNLINKVNIQHDEDLMQENVYIVESIFTDAERGTSIPETFGTPPDGSWWVTFAVDNIDLWEKHIKSGKLVGFSVEGLFKHAKIGEEKAQTLENLHNKIVELRKKLQFLSHKFYKKD
jgi:hypothetical protein